MGVASMRASELSVPSNGRMQLLETAGADTNNENENEALRFESRASVPTVSSKDKTISTHVFIMCTSKLPNVATLCNISQ